MSAASPRTALELYTYCKVHGLGVGISQSWSLKHFGLIENALGPDEQVLTAFVGFYDSQPSTQPTGSSGNAAATKDGNTTSGNTQSGVNINPSSQANTKTQTGGSNQTSNLDWPEGKFLASKNGKVYHRMYCERGMTGAVNIKEENKIWFDSEEEARAAGKERCGNCW